MLIENWRDAWRFLSVQLLIVVGVVAGLEPYIPQLEVILPDKWIAYAMPIIIIARVIRQSSLSSGRNTKVGEDTYE